MRLNIINNFRAIYYNTLANFYLYFNTFVPYYDDVILSLSITSFKNILSNNQISLKSIKEGRLMQLLSTLDDKDRIVVDDDGFIFIDYHPNDPKDSEEDDEEEQEVKETPRETTVADTEETTVEEPVEATKETTVEELVADTVETTVEEPVADTVETTEDTTVEEPVADTEDTTEDTTVEEPVADTECYNSLEKKNN